MLRDPLLQTRCRRHLEELVTLAEKEVVRTHWDRTCQGLAFFYHERFLNLRAQYESYHGDLVAAFGRLQEAGLLEIVTCAATHAVLPLLLPHRESVRAQIRVAVDHYRSCFGRPPVGFWLPECAYAPELEAFLRDAGLHWFVLETHGLLHARPRPRHGVFAPVLTPAGLAAFGRDPASARQVWSRQGGYPGEAAYRDFYRDIGFDLDLEYVGPHLPGGQLRTFTGLKYHRITGPRQEKALYDRQLALRAVEQHAEHFLRARLEQCARLAQAMDLPPLLVAPYDAELFGHWWFEGPEFLDSFVRRAAAAPHLLTLVSPTDYLRRHPTHLVAAPEPSTWGEGGHLKVWLNEKNAWLYPPLRAAQARMRELARLDARADDLAGRVLGQAARELLLAQASDWPFILHTGSSPDYARHRFTQHLARFSRLSDRFRGVPTSDTSLREMELQDNLFPEIDVRYWT
jgi:1,4-alpha-glucan branching enzyme